MAVLRHERSLTRSGWVLDRARDALAARATADVELLVAAVQWAEAHPSTCDDDVAGWGEQDLYGEGLVPLAGEGAPLVAEFAPCELAAALGWTTDAAKQLMGDGLELRYRLPRLFGLLVEQRVPVHLARFAAAETRDLAPEAAADADGLLCHDPVHLTRTRIRASVDEARLYHDPDRAVEAEKQALAARKVELWPGRTPATTELFMTLDTLDAEAFDDAVARVAQALRDLGDADDLQVRRARAVGVLADPQRTLDLLAGIHPGTAKSPATLYLHLDQSQLSDLDTFPASIDCERLGTLSSDLLKAWLADTTVIVKPVIDLSRWSAVDQHDPPTWMAEQVRLRDRHCVFPGCQRPSRRCDLDHVDAYVPLDKGGPPGQTHPGNLAPLCRRHHRAKTHTAWSYQRLSDGGYRWTSPVGRSYTVLPPPPRRT